MQNVDSNVLKEQAIDPIFLMLVTFSAEPQVCISAFCLKQASFTRSGQTGSVMFKVRSGGSLVTLLFILLFFYVA